MRFSLVKQDQQGIILKTLMATLSFTMSRFLFDQLPSFLLMERQRVLCRDDDM